MGEEKGRIRLRAACESIPTNIDGERSTTSNNESMFVSEIQAHLWAVLIVAQPLKHEYSKEPTQLSQAHKSDSVAGNLHATS